MNALEQQQIDSGQVRGGEPSRFIKGALAGAIGGLAASFVMDGLQHTLASDPNKTSGAKQRSARVRRSGRSIRGTGSPSADPATQRVATALAHRLAGIDLTRPQKEAAGAAIHAGFGISVGALYGVAAEALPVVSVATGAPFGAAVWLLADEAALPILGLEKHPLQRSAKRHAGSLLMHIAYGVSLDLVRRGVRSLM